MGWRDIGARGAGSAEVGSAKVIIFRFMYKCFARGARPFLLLGKMPIVKFRGELKNALEAFARAMMEHGVDQPRRESRRPFTVHETTGEKIVVTDHCAYFPTEDCVATFSPGCALNNTEKLIIE